MTATLRLEEVLRNLLDNAIKFSPRGYRSTCKLTTEADAIRIVVWDRGVGVPSQARIHQHLVLTEGVEDRLTCERLADLGCDLAQGYYFDGPRGRRR